MTEPPVLQLVYTESRYSKQQIDLARVVLACLHNAVRSPVLHLTEVPENQPVKVCPACGYPNGVRLDGTFFPHQRWTDREQQTTTECEGGEKRCDA